MSPCRHPASGARYAEQVHSQMVLGNTQSPARLLLSLDELGEPGKKTSELLTCCLIYHFSRFIEDVMCS